MDLGYIARPGLARYAGLSDVADIGSRRMFFGIIVLVTLLRAEKSVANGALTLITLLAVGIALAASIRGYGSGGP